MKRPTVRMLSQADPRRNASLGVAAATYDPARSVAVGIPATAFPPSLVLTAFLSDANAIYTTVAIACSQTLAELTPFGLVLVIRAKIAMPASSCTDHAVIDSGTFMSSPSARKSELCRSGSLQNYFPEISTRCGERGPRRERLLL